ncbi:MAG: sigma-54-dependent Fis family transcriptional regulator [Rhodanobacteraceae bacterium]|nr:sigma-54-dependent Fis family transcriptional regulator [Rhodanobacteraceae bacterium]
MSRQTALVIDDEPDIRELLVMTLTRMGLAVDTAATQAEAMARLAEHAYDLCFTDMRLPDGNGQDIVAHVAKHRPQTPIAMITAFGNVDAAVNALKAGAFDFVSKPVELAVLRRLVQTALKLGEERKAETQGSNDKLIGQSAAMQSVRATIAKVARSQAPVYIRGESGTGKELVARMIHELGPRAAGPFVPVNCGAIPSELMESEFFGHKKGSFTGAATDKEGLFQAAAGGTLFLDEVADLPIHMQVKLLRVIQEKALRAVGSTTEVPIDVRVLSATHRDLSKLVDQGQFRQDLFYRINVIEVKVPPLRERAEDIPMLAEHYLDRIAPEWGIERPQVCETALKALMLYGFPGNVRELENILERAVAMCEDNRIEVDDLRLPEPSCADTASALDALKATSRGGASATDASGTANLVDYIDSLERDAIVKALEECRYNKTKAATKLGITFRALRYKLKKLEIE